MHESKPRALPRTKLERMVCQAIKYRWRLGLGHSTTGEIATHLRKHKSSVKYAVKCLVRDGVIHAVDTSDIRGRGIGYILT